ncbi:class I SAM-dependent methyltransferase, partial [Patescibacteria group bacterium]|nr:class I SAM-dependent methyltransferase [Patescibacteria group bacterium]
MSKQEHYRSRYKRNHPEWIDSMTIYGDLIDKEVKVGTKVLDIGCGHGEFLKDIYSRTEGTYGLDPDEAGLKKNTIIKHKNVGLADEIPFENNFFDVVVSAWVLEHVADPEKVFGEIYRVLKPGGKVIFITPNSWNYIVWINRLIPDKFHDYLTKKLYGRQENDTFKVHYRVNSVGKIEKILSKIGFKKSRIIVNGDPTYISFSNILFHISCLIEWVLNLRPFQKTKV